MLKEDAYEIMKQCGGRPRMEGLGQVWEFGYIHDPDWVAKCKAAGMEDHDPDEDTPTIPKDQPCYLYLYPFMANRKKKVPYNWQLTGSCVNGGGQNMATTRAGIEAICLPEGGSFRIPFTLGAYAMSRWNAFRDNSEGEGSDGGAMAEALGSFGTVDIGQPYLPKPTLYDGVIVYTRQTELKFSAKKNLPAELVRDASGHNFKMVRLKSADEVAAEIRRLRPVTMAGDWGGKMEMQVQGNGANKRLFCPIRYDTWNHQQSVDGHEHNPDLGEIFRVQNQWFMLNGGQCLPVHGPAQLPNEPEGGYWVPKAVIDYQCRTGQVWAARGYKQYDEGKLNFGNV